jgi:hypothetical protein
MGPLLTFAAGFATGLVIALGLIAFGITRGRRGASTSSRRELVDGAELDESSASTDLRSRQFQGSAWRVRQ